MQGVAERLTFAMSAKFMTRIVKRGDSLEFEIIRAAIKKLGFDVEDYIGKYSFTIGPLIYLADRHTEDPAKMIEIVVHEVQHVVQFQKHGLGFAYLYITEPEARAKYEAQAYSAQCEVHHAITGEVLDLKSLVFPMEQPAYRLSAEHIKLAHDVMEVRATQAKAGVYTGESSRFAIDWLKHNAPEALAR